MSEKPFHWHGTMAEFDAEVRRRWIESSERLGLDSGLINSVQERHPGREVNLLTDDERDGAQPSDA